MDIFSEIIQKEEEKEKHLSKYACPSCSAFRVREEKGDIRLSFARDIDRIIHALSYTRYLDKTQVYTEIGNDNISTRMTHVQFVSRAGRTIARALSLNEDLTEAIALGHDIGHSPFGHVGEHILNKIAKEKTGKCFAHNLNSVRVFSSLEKNGRGANLTLQVLDGIMCHNGELVKEKYEPIKKDYNDLLQEYEMCLQDESKIKKLRPMTLEGCIVRIADLIGYLGKDLDDAKRLGKIDMKKLPDFIQENLGSSNNEIMNSIILDVIQESYDKPYISMSKNVYQAVYDLKAFNYENIYQFALDESEKKECEEIFYTLYQVYEKALKNQEEENDIYPVFLNNMTKAYLDTTPLEQKVIDYLSGMTDGFIKRQYQKYR